MNQQQRPTQPLSQYLLTELAHEGLIGVPLHHFLHTIINSQFMRDFVNLTDEKEASKDERPVNVLAAPKDIPGISVVQQQSNDILASSGASLQPLAQHLLSSPTLLPHILKLLWSSTEVQWFHWDHTMSATVLEYNSDQRKSSDGVLWMATESGLDVKDRENRVLPLEQKDVSLAEIRKTFEEYERNYGAQIHPNVFQNMMVLSLVKSYFESSHIWIRITNPSRTRKAMGINSTDSFLPEHQIVILDMALRSRHEGVEQNSVSRLVKLDPKMMHYHVKRLQQCNLLCVNQSYSTLFKRAYKHLYLRHYYDETKLQEAIAANDDDDHAHNGPNTPKSTSTKSKKASAAANESDESDEEDNEEDENDDDDNSMDDTPRVIPGATHPDYDAMNSDAERGWKQYAQFRTKCVTTVADYLKTLKNCRSTAKHLKYQYNFVDKPSGKIAKRRWERIVEILKAHPHFKVYLARITFNDSKTAVRQVVEYNAKAANVTTAGGAASVAVEDETTNDQLYRLDVPLSIQVYDKLRRKPLGSGELREQYLLDNKQSLKFLNRLTTVFPVRSTPITIGSSTEYRYSTSETQANNALSRLSEKVGANNMRFTHKNGYKAAITETTAQRIEWILEALQEQKVLSRTDMANTLTEHGCSFYATDRKGLKRIINFCATNKLAKKKVIIAANNTEFIYLVRTDLSLDSKEVKKLIETAQKRIGNKPTNERIVDLNSNDFDSGVVSLRERSVNNSNYVSRHKMFHAIKNGFLTTHALRLREFHIYLMQRAEEFRLVSSDPTASSFSVTLDIYEQIYKTMPIQIAAKLIGVTLSDAEVRRLFVEGVTIGQYLALSHQALLFGADSNYLSCEANIVPMVQNLEALNLVEVSETQGNGKPKAIRLLDNVKIKMPLLWGPKKTKYYQLSSIPRVRAFWKQLALHIENEEAKARHKDVKSKFLRKFPQLATENWSEVRRIGGPKLAFLQKKYDEHPNPTFAVLDDIHSEDPSIKFETLVLYFFRLKNEYDRKAKKAGVALQRLADAKSMKDFEASHERRKKQLKKGSGKGRGHYVRQKWTDEEDMRLLQAIGVWITSRPIASFEQPSWMEIAQIAGETDNQRVNRRYKTHLSKLAWVRAGIHTICSWNAKINSNVTAEAIDALKSRIQELFQSYRRGTASSLSPFLAGTFSFPGTVEEFHQKYHFHKGDQSMGDEANDFEYESQYGAAESSIANFIKATINTPVNEYDPRPCKERLKPVSNEMIHGIETHLVNHNVLVREKGSMRTDAAGRGYHLTQSARAIEFYGREEIFSEAQAFVDMMNDPRKLLERQGEVCIDVEAKKVGERTGALQMKLHQECANGEVLGMLLMLSDDTLRLEPQLGAPVHVAPSQQGDRDSDEQQEAEADGRDDDEAGTGESSADVLGTFSGLRILRESRVLICDEDEDTTEMGNVLQAFRGHNLRNIELHVQFMSEPNPEMISGQDVLSQVPQATLQQMVRQEHTNVEANPSSDTDDAMSDGDAQQHVQRPTPRKRRRERTTGQDEPPAQRQHSARATVSEEDDLPEELPTEEEEEFPELRPFLKFILQRSKHVDTDEVKGRLERLLRNIDAAGFTGIKWQELEQEDQEVLETYLEDLQNFYVVHKVNAMREEYYVLSRHAEQHVIRPWERIPKRQTTDEQSANNGVATHDAAQRVADKEAASATKKSASAKPTTALDTTQATTVKRRRGRLPAQASTLDNAQVTAFKARVKNTTIQYKDDIPSLPAEPMVQVNGEINADLVRNLKHSLVEKIIDNPGIKQENLLGVMRTAFGPKIAVQFLESMEREGLIYSQEHVLESNVGLFSSGKFETQKCYYARMASYLRKL